MRARSAIGLGRGLVAALAPPRCAICAAACDAADTVCARCTGELRAARPGSSSLGAGSTLVWACDYEATPRALVSALKFAGRLALADLAAEAIARALDETGAEAVVPVPASPLRRRLRGFDPAELIATRLAARLDLPVRRCLTRPHHRRQTGRSRAERLARAPRARVRGAVPPRPLLVDDVLTTGATVRACARALLGGGSERVEAVVFARSA